MSKIEQKQETVHKLKIWPKYFKAVMDGTKTFEVRYNDRRFKVGDRLDLFEFDPKVGDNGEYTGNHCHRYVSYILDANPFLDLQGYAILGLKSKLAALEADKLKSKIAALEKQNNQLEFLTLIKIKLWKKVT